MAKDELEAWLASATEVLVLHLTGVPDVLRRAAPRRLRIQGLALSDPVPPAREWDTILLAVADARELRIAASGLGGHGRARRIGAFLGRPPAQLPVPAPRAGWPAVQRITGTSSPHGFVGLEFACAVPAASVLAEVARFGRRDTTPQWPTVGVPRADPAWWPPADGLGPVARAPRLLDPAADFPPDVALVSQKAGQRAATKLIGAAEAHHVLTQGPAVVVRPAEPAWSEADQYGDLDPLALGPVDERLVNPIGFDKSVTGAAETLVLGGTTAGVYLPEDGRLGDAQISLLRPAAGVELTWRGGSGPVAYCRAVAHLAAAGVPLQSRGEVPAWAGQCLTPELAGLLRDRVVLTDALRREEHSVCLRRAALRSFAVPAWRSGLAGRAGRQHSPSPTVTVLLATRRPEMLRFALRQVARQRGLRGLELVLVTHGFEADEVALADFRQEAPDVDVQVIVAPADSAFGDVLNGGLVRASGDLVVKMDDDDWYGPDFLADLVLARQYSGADVVGCASEFTFVVPLSVTTRRADPSEVYRPWVAGGTLLLERGLLRGLGGFRATRRFVDAALLKAVAAVGGTTYRMHGLGYVLRRGAHGHTWDPGVDYFVDRQRAAEQWHGFRPSALLAADPDDTPVDVENR